MRIVLDFVPTEINHGEDCITRNLRHLLSFRGVRSPDSILAREWSFYYIDLDHAVAPSLAGTRDSEEFEGLRRSGFEVDVQMFDDSSEAWRASQLAIDAGGPAFVWVDVHHLPYDSRSFMIKHRAHTLLVYGYEDDSIAWVMDHPSYSGPIEVSALGMARSSQNPWNPEAPYLSGWPIMNRLLRVDPPETPLPMSIVVSNYLDDMVSNAGDNVLPGYTLQGPKAIERFSDDLRRIVKQGSAGNIFDDMELWHRQLLTVIQERQLGSRLLHSAPSILGDHRSRISQTAKKLSNQWVFARNLCRKALAKHDLTIMSQIAAGLSDIAQTEERFLNYVDDFRSSV